MGTNATGSGKPTQRELCAEVRRLQAITVGQHNRIRVLERRLEHAHDRLRTVRTSMQRVSDAAQKLMARMGRCEECREHPQRRYATAPEQCGSCGTVYGEVR